MTKTKKKDDLSLIFGKVQPNAKESEKYVLGVCLNHPKEYLTAVKEILKPEDFYVSENAIIYEAVVEISEKTVPDIRLVMEHLKSGEKLEQIGGMPFLVSFLEVTPTATPIRQHCLIIKQKSLQRKLVEFSSKTLTAAMDDGEDVFETLRYSENYLSEINNELAQMKVTPIENVAANVIDSFCEKVYKARRGEVDEKAVYTGIKEWDEMNGALFNGLYIIAGRPAMGKGVHLTQLAVNMGKRYKIGIVNGEMTNEQLLIRIGCNLKGIDNFLFKKKPEYIKDEDMDLVREAMDEAIQLNIKLEDKRRIDVIANKIRLWVKQDGVQCVLADFLTIFQVPPEHERYMTDKQKVDYVLNVFVNLTKELKIPIILYAQMNREILGRHGKKEPNLADLKQSGSIEELAYQVSFLHRPEYYDPQATVDEDGNDIKGLMYQIVAKHRDGRIGRIKLKAHLEKSLLTEWEEETFDFKKAIGTAEPLPF
jgi:replicative DNA helicase